MIINNSTLTTLAAGFNAAFREGMGGAKTFHTTVAMQTKSSTAQEVYGWMGQLPAIREWVGSRIIKNIAASAFAIENRKFESTVSVERTKIEDDNIGVYAPLFREMGRRTAEHPDLLIAELIDKAFTSPCYDGQYFFDADHPVDNEFGQPVSVSNYQGGAGTPWFLLDLSREIKPFIYQERMPFALQRVDNDSDEHVFFQDEYIYGVRGRNAGGFGMWQLAYASREPLTQANYETARAAMTSMRGDGGRRLGIVPTHLLVPTTLEGNARRILINLLGPDGESNPWIGSAEMISTPWIA